MTPTEQELSAYRAALAELLQRCLERIRNAPLPDEAAPHDPHDAGARDE